MSTWHVVSTLCISHYFHILFILCQLSLGRLIFGCRYGMFFLLHHYLTWLDSRNSGNRILKNKFHLFYKLILLESTPINCQICTCLSKLFKIILFLAIETLKILLSALAVSFRPHLISVINSVVKTSHCSSLRY